MHPGQESDASSEDAAGAAGVVHLPDAVAGKMSRECTSSRRAKTLARIMPREFAHPVARNAPSASLLHYLFTRNCELQSASPSPPLSHPPGSTPNAPSVCRHTTLETHYRGAGARSRNFKFLERGHGAGVGDSLRSYCKTPERLRSETCWREITELELGRDRGAAAAGDISSS